MDIDTLLSHLSLWQVFAMTLVIVLLSLWGGFRVGNYRRRSERTGETGIGSVVAAMLGLLAFLLAFTFAMTASRYDARKMLLLDEVNAIGTAYLRAGLLPKPQRSEVRQLLREYVDVRAELIRDSGKLRQVLTHSEALQEQLWSHAMALGEKSPNSILAGLFVQSLNEVFDLHTKRVTVGMLYHIPGAIWLVLYLVSILSMLALGYELGLSSRTGMQTGLLLALAFSTLIWLIADLDRATEGMLEVSQQPMIDLQQKLSQSRQ